MTTTVLEKPLCPAREDSVEGNIGGTPLLRLRRITKDLSPESKYLRRPNT